ncbi:hypothetical protein Aperf_G00000073186 [Anoplocephala perfoliata]
MPRDNETTRPLSVRGHEEATDLIRNSNGSCLSRVVYFLTFYTLLAGLFCGYMNSLMYFHIDRDKPRLTGVNSMLGFNPGLSILPRSSAFSSLMHVIPNSMEVTEAFTSELFAFLITYQHISQSVGMSQCARNDGTYQFDPNRPCAFDLGFAHPCNLESNYGYDGASPCILLKMNKIYGWLPDPVDGATGVIVKCEGVTKDDQINLGRVRYYDLEHLYSSRGWKSRNEGKVENGTFHADFYPYLNQKWYLQPIVWVVFDNVKHDTFIRAQCYLIAKNIHVNFNTGEGSIRFELLVE